MSSRPSRNSSPRRGYRTTPSEAELPPVPPSYSHSLTHGSSNNNEDFGVDEYELPSRPSSRNSPRSARSGGGGQSQTVGSGPGRSGRTARVRMPAEPQYYPDQQQQQQQYGQPPQRQPQYADPQYQGGGFRAESQHQLIHDDDISQQNYYGGSSMSPARMIVRKKTVRRIELFHGNLVLNCPVPDKLIQNVPLQATEEVQACRYTAATCHPDNFSAENYTLRQVLYQRQTELAVCMTMYNEDDDLFARTMYATMKNIAYLCSRDRSKVWGSEGWKKITVVVVADGRNKIHPRVLETLGIMGCFQDGVMKDNVNDKPTTAHIFEYTTQVCIDTDKKVRGQEKGLTPVQIIFLLKEKNQKKLNSHRWFFNALCPLLNPNVCILLDVGTRPTTSSFYHLWKAFDQDGCVGGACGEITADLGYGCVNLVNPLVAAQNFEYKMSNILDKPLESAFGYISVLPGAFSAYRYRALLNTAPGVGPLASYFEGEELHNGSANIFKANMYLAEDRILCFELVAKQNQSWHLKYVKAARADTDVPDGIAEFISQRRRWLNGSFFAMTYALAHWYKILGTSHGIWAKFWFQVQLVYNTVNMLFTWFGIALFYLSFFFLSQNVITKNDPFGGYGNIIYQVFRQLYIFCIILCVVISLGNRPQSSKNVYMFAILLFAVVMGMILFLVGFTIATAITAAQTSPDGTRISVGAALVTTGALYEIIIPLLATFGIYFLISFLHGDPWHMFTCFVQYSFMLPSFINILMIYSFCNTHDVSWGTKGDNKAVALGGAQTSSKDKAAGTVELELPFENSEDKGTLNVDYDKWLRHLSTKNVPEPAKVDLATQLEDWYKSFRTRLVLVWLISNALLIVALTNESVIQKMSGGSNPNDNPFLKFMFWSFTGLTLFRFIGSLVFLSGYYKDRTLRCC